MEAVLPDEVIAKFKLEKHVVIGDLIVKDCWKFKTAKEELDFHIDWVLINATPDKLVSLLERIMVKAANRPLCFSIYPWLNSIPTLTDQDVGDLIARIQELLKAYPHHCVALGTMYYSPAYIEHRDKMARFNFSINDFNMQQGLNKHGLAGLGLLWNASKTKSHTRERDWAQDGLLFKDIQRVADTIRKYLFYNFPGDMEPLPAVGQGETVVVKQLKVTVENIQEAPQQVE